MRGGGYFHAGLWHAGVFFCTQNRRGFRVLHLRCRGEYLGMWYRREGEDFCLGEAQSTVGQPLHPPLAAGGLSNEWHNSTASAAPRAPHKKNLLAKNTPSCATIYVSTRFFLTRMARNFRNYHPAHLDTTEHRFAMGG